MAGRKILTVAVSVILIVFFVFAAASAAESTVKIWEEPQVIPTYRVDAPDLNPMFYKGEVYQGAKKTIYPYPFLDKLTDIRENKTYRQFISGICD